MIESLEPRVLFSGGSSLPVLRPGSLDPTFGVEGVVAGGMPLGIQPDGKILLDGFRLNADGSPDSSYTPPEASTSTIAPFRAAVDSAGRLVFGTGNTVTRLRADNGSPDTSFGSGGSFQTADEILSVAVQPKEKVLVMIQRGTGTNPVSVFLQRYNSDGTPDASFGNNGSVAVETSPAGVIYTHATIHLSSDGHILLDLLYDPNPTTNASAIPPDRLKMFGADGSVAGSYQLPSELGPIVDCQFQQGNKILFAATPRSVIVLKRLNLDGSADSTFGQRGQSRILISTGLQTNGEGLQMDDVHLCTLPTGTIVLAELDQLGNYVPPYVGSLGTSAKFRLSFTEFTPNGRRVPYFGILRNWIGSMDLNDALFSMIAEPDGGFMIGIDYNPSLRRFLTTPTTTFATMRSGTLSVYGSSAGDVISLTQIDARQSPTIEPAIQATVNGDSILFDAKNVKRVRIVWPKHGIPRNVTVPFTGTLSQIIPGH